MTEEEKAQLFSELKYLRDVADDINGRINMIEDWILDQKQEDKPVLETNM
jgi:hypothetical protein